MHNFITKYKIEISLLYLILAILSTYLPALYAGGIQLNLFRIITIGLGAYFIAQKPLQHFPKGKSLAFISSMGVFTFLAIISYMWADNKDAWLNHVLFWGLNTMCVYIIFRLLYDVTLSEQKKMGKYTFMLLVLLSCVAVIESVFQYHIDGDRVEFLHGLKYGHPQNKVPVLGFDNPNNFGLFMVLASYLMICISKNRLLVTGSLLMSLFTSVLVESKLSILLTFILFAYFVYKYFNKSYLKLVVPAILIVIAILYTGLVNVPSTQLFLKSNPHYITGPILPEQQLEYKQLNDSTVQVTFVKIKDTTKNSTAIRKSLYKAGISLFKQKKITGWGAGQFEVAMKSEDKTSTTNNITNPHSLVLRLLVEFGISGIMILLILLIYLLYTLKPGLSNLNFYIASGVFVSVIIVGSNIPSSTIGLSWIWLMLTIITVLSKTPNKSQHQQ